MEQLNYNFKERLIQEVTFNCWFRRKNAKLMENNTKEVVIKIS